MVTSDNHKAAAIGPAPRANGRALPDVLRRWSGHEALDDAFAENVSAVRVTATAELDADPAFLNAGVFCPGRR
jgi:hypothetical protein